jgi:hypothetical protein
MPRALAATSVLVAVALVGGEGRCDPACPPRILVAPEIPQRLADRLRARLATLDPGDPACGALQFRWDRNRLVIEVALQDGRVARRTLRSLEDALPTALAVLALPPAEPEPVATTPPPAPVPTPTPPPASPTEDERPTAAPVPPTSVPAPADPPLRLRVGGAMGGAWSAGRWFFLQRAEVELRHRRLVLGLRADWAGSGEGDDELRAQSYGLAARWHLPRGRWQFELGAVVAASALRFDVRGANARDRTLAWSLRVGADVGASFAFTRALSAFARVESTVAVARFSGDDALHAGSPLGVSATLGLRLEVAP